MTLKSKKKNYFDETVFKIIYITRKLELQGYFCGKGSGSGIFPDPDPGDPKRLDPTGSGSATLVYITFLFQLVNPKTLLRTGPWHDSHVPLGSVNSEINSFLLRKLVQCCWYRVKQY